jgi:ribonuclease PH
MAKEGGMVRIDGRQANALRELQMDRQMNKYAEGSCMIWLGDTQVLCTASVEDRVPPFLKGKGEGWVTAEYSMLPRATLTRSQREVAKGHPSGRSMEIQRLIGRALRAVVEMRGLGERTITIDCDVIQADGGTRTASITGGFVALYEALRWMRTRNMIRDIPLVDSVAAISVGIVDGYEMLDLCYEEDSRAAVDMNVIMTGKGRLVEVQGTAEGLPFTREQMNGLLDLGEAGIRRLTEAQKRVLEI